MSRIELGGTYTSNDGATWECIYIRGDIAWLAMAWSSHLGTAYRFSLDGIAEDLGGVESFNITFDVDTTETP